MNHQNKYPDNSTGEPALVMTTAEMLELAGIDALGLLDDAEHDAFDRAFACAPSAVRELVRAEQARVAELGLALPDADVDPSLRARFLERVRAEIAKANEPVSRSNSKKNLGLNGDRLAGSRVASHDAARHEPRSLGLRRAKRVSSFWRVATVGVSVAAVVLAVLQVQLRQKYNQLENDAQIASLIDAIGIEHVEDVLFSGAVQRVQFSPVGATGRAQAMLLHNTDRDRSRLYVMNLASRTGYSLVTVDAKNTPIDEIGSFETDDLLTSVDVSLPGRSGETIRVAIMTTDEDPRVLFVASIRLA